MGHANSSLSAITRAARTAVAVVCAVLLTTWGAGASGHGDAPLIVQDPQANITDVYAFIGTKFDDAGVTVLNIIVCVHPYCEPGAGAIYGRFADDALYSIHIVNPTTGDHFRRFDFKFSNSNPTGGPKLKNKNTIFSYGVGTETGPIIDGGDARHNFTQTYSVTRVSQSGNMTELGSNLLTPPPNVGLRTTPYYNDSQTGRAISGATQFNELDKYTQQTIHDLGSGIVVFAGQREDPFYGDIAGIFDLLDSRILDNNANTGDGLGQDGGGVDAMKGYNVLAIAMQIPVDSLPSFEYNAPFADLAEALPSNGTSNGVGVFASVSRPRKTIRRANGDPKTSGPYIQVNRMGNPLFNEMFVALRSKDKYNLTLPATDPNKFIDFALSPEMASMYNLVFATNFVTSGRTDLSAVFIPDVLRVDTTTAAVRLPGASGFSRLGFIGGDTTTDSGGQTKSSGWPNGRRPGDDVVDIALSLLASGPTYSSVTVVGDNTAANDQLYNKAFPYLGTPHAGLNHSKDSGEND